MNPDQSQDPTLRTMILDSQDNVIQAVKYIAFSNHNSTIIQEPVSI